MVAVRQRLAHAAEAFLRESDLGLSMSGRVYLLWLLTKAARVIVQEGKARDESELRRAEEAVHILLSTAAGLGTTRGSGVPLGLYFGVGPFLAAEYGVPRREISARDLRAALHKLCPIWPFCRRKR